MCLNPDDILVSEMDEAMARLARGELRESLLWLGRAHPGLEQALRLYDAEKRAVELVVSDDNWQREIAA